MARDDFACIESKCNHITTVRRSINDKPLSIAKCGKCSGIAKYIFSAHAKTAIDWRVR